MIYVLGSIHNDITLELERLPKKGETIVADSCIASIGGKGACQAISIAKLSKRDDKVLAPVRLIARIGSDAIGEQLLDKLINSGVDTQFVRKVNRQTGFTLASIAGKDERKIIYNGANNGLSKTDVDEALEGATAGDTLLCQLEVPLYIVMYALRKAHSIGMTTILDPSPATSLPDDIYYNVDIIVPNMLEVRSIAGIVIHDFETQLNAIRYFHSKGVQYVVLTLGGKGCTISDGAYIVAHIPATKVDVVDHSCAGDAFVGALALAYPHIGMYSFEEACRFATKAAGITVSRFGTIDSTPSREEVLELYNNYIS